MPWVYMGYKQSTLKGQKPSYTKFLPFQGVLGKKGQKQDYNTLFFYSSGESNLTILSNNLFRNGRLTKYATSSTRMLLDSSFR